MKTLEQEQDIWKLQPNKKDLIAAAKYAAITLPWTFNRMFKNTSSRGQNDRALNIAKGIVAQEVLRRKLSEVGIKAETERKSYRDSDLFDFKIFLNGNPILMDIKSFNYYTDYKSYGREDLSSSLIIGNADYPGPDWRRFFPMLVPHTQIRQDKEAYCFAISSSIDFRRDISTNRNDFMISAFPHGEIMPFLSDKRLILEREAKENGIYIDITLRQEKSLFKNENLNLIVKGEWNEEQSFVKIELQANKKIENIGPFSAISSFEIDKESYDKFIDSSIEIEISDNHLSKPVLNSSKRNVNKIPDKNLVIEREDFCNLVLPNDYQIYYLGWITKEEYLAKVSDYVGYVWPNDDETPYENQLWTQITEKDKSHLERANFEDNIEYEPKLLNAGWMKTHGRGGGACCYVFPNIGYMGGIKENNLYILPSDLYTMNELS